MKITSILLCVLVVFCNVSPVKAVLVKSDIDNEKQRITVYFSEKKFSFSEIEKMFGKNFEPAKAFDHDGIYRQVSQTKLTELIEDSIGYKNKNISNISFYFSNISTKKQLGLLNSLMLKFNGIISDIYDDHERKIKNLDINYSYFDHQKAQYHGRWGWTHDAEKPKKEFEEAVEKFKDLKREIEAKKKEQQDFRKWDEQQFIQNNYPKANIYKGEQ